MLTEILVPLSFFALVFGIVYMFLMTRNRERLALIEKGADAKLFKTGSSFKSGVLVLNIALLAIGVGIGVLLGALLEETGMDEEVAYPAMIFLWGGIGLLAAWFINRKLNSAKEKE